MKFSQDQVEAFRSELGITTEAATEAMQRVATMVAESIRAAIEATDPDGLRDGDSYCQGMERAASIADTKE